MANELNKVIAKHYKGKTHRSCIARYKEDYIQAAHDKCAPYITALVNAVRALHEGKEKRSVMSAAIGFSRATEAHIANLELEMSNLEYQISMLFERNRMLEWEIKRCHAKIDITDSITLSMAGILKNKLEHAN